MQIPTIPIVVPQCLAAAKAKTTAVRMDFIGIDSTHLAGFHRKAREAEILARVAGIQSPSL